MTRANQNFGNLFKLFQMKYSRNYIHVQVVRYLKKYDRVNSYILMVIRVNVLKYDFLFSVCLHLEES